MGARTTFLLETDGIFSLEDDFFARADLLRAEHYEELMLSVELMLTALITYIDSVRDETTDRLIAKNPSLAAIDRFLRDQGEPALVFSIRRLRITLRKREHAPRLKIESFEWVH